MQYAYNEKEIMFLKTSKYMMATKAMHGHHGDLSREKPDICTIVKQDEENFYGMWLTGPGYFNILFPKETTRELTPKENEYWNKRSIQINNQSPQKLKAD